MGIGHHQQECGNANIVCGPALCHENETERKIVQIYLEKCVFFILDGTIIVSNHNNIVYNPLQCIVFAKREPTRSI